MNIIQQQEALKDLSDSQIASEMQRPSGQMPLYLVSTEAKRRADLRNRYKTDASGPPLRLQFKKICFAALCLAK